MQSSHHDSRKLKKMSEKVEVVVSNATKHGEGPHWDDTTQCLYYVDIIVGDVKRYNAVTGEDDRLHIGDTLCTIVVPREKGGLVSTQKKDIVVVDSWESGKVTTFAEVESGQNVLNDGKVDASGRLWIGSCCPKEGENDINKWGKGQGSLFSVDPDGKVKTCISDISLSNGMEWTDDNSIMYYIDSSARQVWAFDFDINTGNICNQRTVADFSHTEVSELGYPDGMTVDTEGKLWVACFDGGRVIRVDPETGKIIHTVKFPVSKTTSCCFGGKDFSDLYVTTTPFTMTPEELKQMPLSGSIFKVTGLGVKGRKANNFAG